MVYLSLEFSELLYWGGFCQDFRSKFGHNSVQFLHTFVTLEAINVEVSSFFDNVDSFRFTTKIVLEIFNLTFECFDFGRVLLLNLEEFLLLVCLNFNMAKHLLIV